MFETEDASGTCLLGEQLLATTRHVRHLSCCCLLPVMNAATYSGFVVSHFHNILYAMLLESD